MRCTEWTLHAVESHIFSVSDVTNLATALLTGGRGPLIKTSAPQEQCSKYQFYLNISDCCFTMSFAMVCKIFEILLISFADTIPIFIQYKFNSLMFQITQLICCKHLPLLQKTLQHIGLAVPWHE